MSKLPGFPILKLIILISLTFWISCRVYASPLPQQETPYSPPNQTGEAPTESYPYPATSPTPTGGSNVTSTSTSTSITPTPASTSSTPLLPSITPTVRTATPQQTVIHRFATEMAELAQARIIPEVTDVLPTRSPPITPSLKNNLPETSPKENINFARFGLGILISLVFTLGAMLLFRLLQSGEFRIKE